MVVGPGFSGVSSVSGVLGAASAASSANLDSFLFGRLLWGFLEGLRLQQRFVRILRLRLRQRPLPPRRQVDRFRISSMGFGDSFGQGCVSPAASTGSSTGVSATSSIGDGPFGNAITSSPSVSVSSADRWFPCPEWSRFLTTGAASSLGPWISERERLGLARLSGFALGSSSSSSRAHRFGIGALFFHQRFAIRDRDLVVIRMDLRKRQETMAVSAIVHKCRLQRRFDPGYFCEVDVASKLAFVFGFKVEFLNLVSIDHHNAGLFRVGGIDKHFLSHVSLVHDWARWAPASCPGGQFQAGRLTRFGWCLVRAISDGAVQQVVPASMPGLPASSAQFALARVIAVLLRQAGNPVTCPFIIPAPVMNSGFGR